MAPNNRIAKSRDKSRKLHGTGEAGHASIAPLWHPKQLTMAQLLRSCSAEVKAEIMHRLKGRFPITA